MSANENKGAIGCAVYDVVPATICSARLSVESVARWRKNGVIPATIRGRGLVSNLKRATMQVTWSHATAVTGPVLRHVLR
jgi:hypothetical protein